MKANNNNRGREGVTTGLIGALAGQGEGRRNLANQLALICQRGEKEKAQSADVWVFWVYS